MDIFPCRHHRDEDIDRFREFFFCSTQCHTEFDEFSGAFWSTIPDGESASFCEDVFRHGDPHEPETDESDMHRESIIIE